MGELDFDLRPQVPQLVLPKRAVGGHEAPVFRCSMGSALNEASVGLFYVFESECSFSTYMFIRGTYMQLSMCLTSTKLEHLMGVGKSGSKV